MPETNFVRGFNPVWSLVDLAGKQFDDTFYMYTLENTVPYVPQAVFHDVSGNIPWTDPIQFLANGTLPVDIYWTEGVVYRLEFRQNVGPLPPSQADPLIYLVENYIPTGSLVTPGEGNSLATDNQLSNPQFAVVNFQSPLILTNITNPPPLEIAPDWFLTLSGTGNVRVEQIPLYDAPGLTTPTNAPYALRIMLTGGWVNNAILSQRLHQNGMLWGNKTVSASITARNDGIPTQLLCRLDASNGATLAVLITPTINNVFEEYQGNFLLPAPVNPDVPPSAYIEYKIFMPTTGDIYLTSMQLVASDETGVNLEYQQITVDRQIDQLFHYYNPQLQYKPIPSYLTGWDFPLNPAQLGSTQGPFTSGIYGANYVWDQTIVAQSIDSAYTAARNTDGSLQLTVGANPAQLAVIQYLDGPQVQELLQNDLSVYFAANSSLPTNGTISLWAISGALPVLPLSVVLTLDANGLPATQTGAWTQITRQNMQNAAFSLTQTNPILYNEFAFNGWLNTNQAIITTSTYFAVVIGFGTLPALTVININCASLNLGSIATRPAPKTVDETQRDCERYYEYSYASAGATSPVGTNPNFVNALMETQSVDGYSGSNFRMRINSFSFDYRTLKRTNPAVTIYSTQSGAVGNVYGYFLFSDLAGAAAADVAILNNWAIVPGSKRCLARIEMTDSGLNPAVATPGTAVPVTSIMYHFVADARLGVV